MRVAALGLLLLVARQDPPTDALLRSLGADDPVERDRAAKALEARGAEAIEPLRKAAGAPDAEVAARAREILLRIRVRRFSSLRLDRSFGIQAGFGRADHFRVTPDGKHAVGHDLEFVRVWTVPEGRGVSEWRPHPRNPRDFDLSADGSRLLTWSYEGLALWEMPTGKLVRRYDGMTHVPRSFALTGDGKRLAWASLESVQWIEVETGRTVWSATEDQGLRTPVAVALSPDGSRIGVVGVNSTNVHVRDAATGAIVLSFRVRSTGFQSRVAFTPDGASLVVSNRDQGKAWRHSATTGALDVEASDDEFETLAGGTLRYKVVHPRDEKAYEGFTVMRPPKEPFPDSPWEWEATADRRHVLVRTLNGRRVLVFEGGTGRLVREIGDEASTFGIAPEGVLVGTRKGELALHDLEGKELGRVRGGAGAVARATGAGKGRAIWIDGENVLRCSELASGKELWRREYFALGTSGHALAPDGLHAVGDLVERGRDQSHVVRWELATGREVSRYGAFRGYLAGVAVSPDGKHVAASTRDGPLAVWEADSKKKLWDWRPGRNARWLRFSPDGASLFAGDDDGRVARHATRTGAVEHVYAERGKRVWEGALSPDGLRLAAIAEGEALTVWDVASGEAVRSWKRFGRGGVAFLEGGTRVISGSPVTLGDVASGEVLSSAEGAKALRAAGLDPSRERLGVLFEGGRFAVFDLESGRPAWERRAPERAMGFQLGPRGESVVFFGEQGWEPQSFRKGEEAPVGRLEKLGVVGFDAARGRVYTAGSSSIQGRDFLTFEVREEAAVEGAQAVLGFPGAAHLYARIGGSIVRLSPATLQPLGPVCEVDPKSAWEVDPRGELLRIGEALHDPETGRLRGRVDAAALKGMSATFFSGSGDRVVAVTPEGAVQIFSPNP